MTGEELKDFVEVLIDDSIDSVTFYQLLNVAKDEVEDDRIWELLKAFDSSQTASPGDTYLTMKTLVSTFRFALGNVFVGSDLLYKPIPFENRYIYKDRNGFYYIDLANGQFAIIGAPGSVQTINFPYITTTDEIEATTSWTFPSRFHKLLGFMVAGYYTMGVDADDIYARMSPEHKLAASMVRQSMENWNNKLALNNQDYSSSPYFADNDMGLRQIGDM